MKATITAEKWRLYDTNPSALTDEEFKAIYRMEENRYERYRD